MKVGLKTRRKMSQALTYNQSPVSQWRYGGMVSALDFGMSSPGSSPSQGHCVVQDITLSASIPEYLMLGQEVAL